MKKTIVLVIGLLAICLILVGCAKKEEAKNYVIELEANHTTGYSWAYKVADEGIVEVENEYVLKSNEDGMAGAGGVDKFTIKGVKEGTTTIEFTYTRPWEPSDADKTETYEITVDKNLNVTGRNVK